LLDIVVAPAVEEIPRADTPLSPAEGASYIVALSATGDWAGHDHCLACYSGGGWRYVPAIEGMRALVKDSGLIAAYRVDGWEIGVVRGASVEVAGYQVVGPRAPAITDPTGGAVIDAEAREALAEILSALRHHGLIAS
jgi:hypothetical protein